MEDQDKRVRMFELVEQWQQGGQSQKQFSLEQGIKLASFGYWVKKYRQQKASETGFANVAFPKNRTA